MNQYRQACAEHDRRPRAVALRRDVYIGPSAKAAAGFKAKAVARGYRGFAEDALLCGEVKAVAEQFAEFAEAGFTDIIVRNMASDQSDALATIEALSEVRRELNL